MKYSCINIEFVENGAIINATEKKKISKADVWEEPKRVLVIGNNTEIMQAVTDLME